MVSCSLLVPCHNAAKYLPRLMETVKDQAVHFDEVICYDDGSTDNSVEVAEKLGMQVIRGQQCRGPAFARNKLAKATACDWFHFHDADDLLCHHYLERTKCNITSEIDVILCNVDWVDADTNRILIPFRYSNQELQNSPSNYLLSHPVGGINGLYRKTTFLQNGGFNESLRIWEDADLHVRLAVSGARFVVIEEVLAISLRHSQTASHNYKENWRCRLQILQQYVQDCPSLSRQEISREAEKAANNLLAYKDYSYAKTAIQLCVSLGGSPPSTKNLFLKAMKFFLPNFWLVLIQNFIRNHSFPT